MEIVICPSAEEVGRIAASKIAQVASRLNRALVLGVATGSSPLALYREMAYLQRRGTLDLTGASAFALDEYVGLPRGHVESYAEVIRRTVTEPLGLDPDRVHVPDGFADDIDEAARLYDEMIRDVGGVDVQILGLGANGHIGFNEPTSSLNSRTRLKTLLPQTRRDNARFFDSPEQVPTHCITQGLGTIMEARTLLLVAQGEAKADAVSAMVEGPLTAMVPGSVLQTHRSVTVIVDEAAAAKLTLSDYYRWIWDNKPVSQWYYDPSLWDDAEQGT